MWMFLPLPSASLHFSNKSQGFSLSIPLCRFAFFSSTNPCTLCLQNSYVHLWSQRIKVTLQERVYTSVLIMPNQATAFASLPSHASVSISGEMSPALDSWCNVVLLLIQMPRSHQQLVSWGANHQDVSADSGNLSLTCQKPFLSLLLFLFNEVMAIKPCAFYLSWDLVSWSTCLNVWLSFKALIH